MITKIKHVDGEWYTTEFPYLGRVVMIKSCPNKGMKAHCLMDGNVIFTQRFKWIKPDHLLKRMKDRIDMWEAGTWTPKKLIKK